MPLALLTGGGSLLGEGITRALTRDGWTVAVTDLKAELANKAAAEAGNGRALASVLDVNDPAAIKATISGLLGKHGRIDALVNAAGGGRGIGVPKMDFVDSTPDIWRKMLETNFESVLRCSHAVLPSMIGAGGGSIVSIAAARGLKGGPQAALYSAAKAAIIVFSQSLAQEVGKYNVRVNSGCPGNAEARWKKAPDLEATRSPLGRATTGDDVGNIVAFLCSDRALHVTGSCYDVSGGTALH
jgi:NAD(P)-dependent dehydrogenase (short-subunit alcohol dehydrogenase family)